MANLKLHVVSVTPVLRMPKVMIYDLVSLNHLEIYGKGKVKIRPFFETLIPLTCDQHIFVVAGGYKVSPTIEMRVNASIKDVDYGDKFALYLSQRKVVLKPKPPSKIQKAKDLKEEFDKKNLARRVKGHARDTLTAMIGAILSPEAVAEGTRVDPAQLKTAEAVVEQALAELSIPKELLAEVPETIPGFAVGLAAAGGVIKLGMAALHAVRAYKLNRTANARSVYPEFIYDRRDGEVLFDRVVVHYKKQAAQQVIGAVKKFVEMGFRVAVPGSIAFVTTAKLADQVYMQVLFRAREFYEVDLTNQMLRLAEQANSSEGFYDTISCGHIFLPADVINRYNAHDLSSARRTYIGEAQNVEALLKGVADLKSHAKR